MRKIVLTSFVFIFFFFCSANAKIDTQVIKSASEYDYPPMCLVTDGGEADGFSVDLLKATLEAVDLKADFYVGPWNKIRDDLAEGRIQVLPLVGRTPEREEIFDFTFPYLSLHGAIFVRKENESIQDINDLKNKEVAVMLGDNAEEYVRRNNISNKIITTATYEEAMESLSSGKYDAVIAQEVMGLQLLRHLGIENVVKVNYDLDDFVQDFSFAVREGDKNLLEELNEGLSIVMANGKYNELYSKWFVPVFEHEITFKDVGKYVIIIFVPFLLIFSLILIIVLRLKIKSKTINLVEEIEERKKIQENLIHNEHKLKRLNDDLKKVKNELQDKNKELEETLEDFYTMRIGMQRDLKLGQVEQENKKMKKRLDKLKKK